MNLYAVYTKGKPAKYLLSEDAGAAMEQMIANINDGNGTGQLKLIADIPPETESALADMNEHERDETLKQIVEQHKANLKLYRVYVDGFVVCPWTEANSEEEAIENIKAKGAEWSAKQIPHEMAAKIIAATDEMFGGDGDLPSSMNDFITLQRNAILDRD